MRSFRLFHHTIEFGRVAKQLALAESERYMSKIEGPWQVHLERNRRRQRGGYI